jgi:hypothetical protein
MQVDPTATPNVYSVWITLIVTLGPIVAAAVTVYLNRKLGKIHTLVNGNLHTAQQKVAELRAKLKEHGIDAD